MYFLLYGISICAWNILIQKNEPQGRNGLETLVYIEYHVSNTYQDICYICKLHTEGELQWLKCWTATPK